MRAFLGRGWPLEHGDRYSLALIRLFFRALFSYRTSRLHTPLDRCAEVVLAKRREERVLFDFVLLPAQLPPSAQQSQSVWRRRAMVCSAKSGLFHRSGERFSKTC